MVGRRSRAGRIRRPGDGARVRPSFLVAPLRRRSATLAVARLRAAAARRETTVRERLRREVRDAVLVVVGALVMELAFVAGLAFLLSQKPNELYIPPSALAEGEVVPVEFVAGPRAPGEVSTPAKKKEPPKPEKKKEKEDLSGEIVHIPRPDVESKPKQPTKHLARWDHDAEKEQRSRHRGRPRPSGGGAGGKAPVAPSIIRSPDAVSPEPTRARRGKVEDSILGTPRPPRGRPPQSGPSTADGSPVGAPEELLRKPPTGLLLPNGDEDTAFGNLQSLLAEGKGKGSGGGIGEGGFGSDDALLDITGEGEDTILRTRAFRYWDFFEQVREAVREEWAPNDVWRSRDPSGVTYGVKPRYTVIRVTLDRDGKVVKLVTKKECGVAFLDTEARRAIKAAQPFRNVPGGLVEDTGYVTFSFGFLFEIKSGGVGGFWGG